VNPLKGKSRRSHQIWGSKAPLGVQAIGEDGRMGMQFSAGGRL